LEDGQTRAIQSRICEVAVSESRLSEFGVSQISASERHLFEE
jgi:hypothetical protein